MIRKISYYLLLLLFIYTLPAYPIEIELEFDFDAAGDALPSALLKGAEEAYALNMKGLDALAVDDLDAAQEYFSEASEHLPNYSDAINNSGVVYYRRGNIAMARELWHKVLSIDPEYATASYNLGMIAYNDRKYEKAQDLFTRALEANKRFVHAMVMLGRIALRAGKLNDALRILKKAHTVNPSLEDAWSMLAYVHVLTGDTVKARSILLKYPKSAQALSMLGQIEAKSGRTKQAIRYFSDALARGAAPRVYLDIAQLHLATGRCPDAHTAMRSYFAKASHPPADAWLLAGIVAKECGTIAETKKYFEQGLAAYPRDQLLRFNLGQVYFYEKDYTKAETVWDALADTLHDPALFYLRAVAARKQKNIPAAEACILKALALDTKAEYLDFLGVILYEKGEKNEAVIQFKKALAINPALKSAQLNLAIAGKTDAHISAAITDLKNRLAACRKQCTDLSLQLSILYYHNRQYEKAAATLTVIPDREKDLRIYRHLAMYYTAQAEWQKAIQALERAKKRFTLDQQVKHELAEAYCAAGFYAKAIALLEELVPVFQGNPWRLYYQLGYAYVKQHEYAGAEWLLQRSLAEKKDNVAARSFLAYIYNEQKEVDKARKIWEKTVQDDPSNPALWINLGLLRKKQGDYAGAIENFQKALSLGKENTAVSINIGNVYEQMQKPKKALQAYEKALTSDKRDAAAYNICIVAIKLSDRRRADAMLSLLKREFPASLHTRRATGDMLLWNGDTTAALPLFESLPQKNSEDWYALAAIYIAQKKTARAQDAVRNLPDTPHWRGAKNALTAQLAFTNGNYQQAYALWSGQNDTSFDAQYNLALAAFHAQEYETAERVGKKLVQRASGPDRTAIYRLLGNTAIKTENWEDAHTWFSKLTRIKPDDAVAWFNMAVAAYNQDAIDDAWEWYQKAREQDQSLVSTDIENRYHALHAEPKTREEFDSLDEVFNQAVQLQQQGRDDMAEVLYTRILKQDRRFYRAWNNLGAIYGARGEYEKAIDCYKNAVSRRADIADGYANLVNIYIVTEDFKKAERWLARGKKKNPESEVLANMENALKEAKRKVK